MCGRCTFRPTAAVYERFEVRDRLDALVPCYHSAPRQMVPVSMANSPRRIVCMRWGVMPHWATDEKTAYNMIHARVETRTPRPAFRGLLSHHRCLVPASGFYEWQGEGRDKTPSSLYPAEQSDLAFTGLDDVWITATGEALSTLTIITTAADLCMARLHNRMPLILAREREEAWLDLQLTQAQEVLDVLSRSPGLELDTYPIARMVHRPSVDSEALIQRVE